MEYVAIGILFLLVLGGGITLFVMVNAKQDPEEHGSDDSADTAGAPFSGRDHTPMGDTAQHAGQQDEHGQTVSQQDAERGGTGAKTSGPGSTGHGSESAEEPTSEGRFKTELGGEAEGSSALPAGAHQHPRDR